MDLWLFAPPHKFSSACHTYKPGATTQHNMTSKFSVKSSFDDVMGFMDGICCANQKEKHNDEQREKLRQFFSLYDFIDPQSHDRSTSSSQSRYAVFKAQVKI
jgi:hypothetical protein